MSISDAIAPHIPFLRRFARALCGTQAAGDAYVAATLEEILADPHCFDAELDPKVALYKLFLRSWRNSKTQARSVPAKPQLTLQRIIFTSRCWWMFCLFSWLKHNDGTTIAA